VYKQYAILSAITKRSLVTIYLSYISDLVPVDELMVYKKYLKQKSIGIRWSFNDTDVIDGFIVIAIDETLNSTKQIIVEPKRCVAWPTFFCTTMDNLIPNNQYTIKVLFYFSYIEIYVLVVNSIIKLHTIVYCI